MSRSFRQALVLIAVVFAFGAVLLLNRGRDSMADGKNATPFASWSFDASKIKGKTVPDSIGSLEATLQGSPVLLAGKPTEAIEFRSDADFVAIRNNVEPNAEFLPTQAMTVAAWVRIDEGTRYGGICGLIQDNGDFERGWLLGYDETHFTFALAGQATQPKLTYMKGKSPFAPGKWHHVAGSYDGKTMRLFVNGKQDAESGEQTGAISYPPKAPFLIGRYRDADEDYPMRGAIKQVSLYHTAVAPEGIAGLFAADKALTELPSTAGNNRFVIKPYLQMPTQNGITVMWETALPGSSVVEYGTTPAKLKKVELKPSVSIHEVKLDGMGPEERCVYRVSTTMEDGSTLTSPFYQFMTAVKPDSAFSFAIIGDTQKNPKVTAKIAKLMYERRPHFVMHCGDVVNTGPAKSEWVHELFGPCADLFARCAVMPTLGNHEQNHAWYYRYFSLPAPEYYYRYSYGNADFFVVDTNKKVGPDSEQYKWLDAELAKSTAKWKIAYHHHPVWTSDSNDYGDTQKGIARFGDLNARNLNTLYEKHNVDVVFNGHIHLYERTFPLRAGKVDRKSGVTYVTSGGGGGGLEDFGPLPTWFKAQLRVDYHFCYVNVQGGHFEFKAFDQNGQLFDVLELNK